MDFSWSEQQQSLWEETVRFAQEHLTDDVIARDQNQVFPESHWQAIAQQGLFGLNMPEAYGGCGYNNVTTARTLEALGYGCHDNGLTLAVNGQVWAIQEPILSYGTEAQKQKYLPAMLKGTIKGAHSITEPTTGSDAFKMKTTASKVNGGYVLNGHKAYVGMGPIADFLLVFVTLNPELGPWGVTAFLVDTDSPGVTLGDAQAKMGLRTEPMGDVLFEDVFVPAANILGREGAGASIFNKSVQYERSFIFASHIGSMARQLDDTIRYARERQVGGQPIGKYQSVANRIADMKVRLETARMFMYRAASVMDQGHDAMLESAMAKLAISELFVDNSLDAVRVHGGRGYLSEQGVERDLRDAVGGVIYAGTSDIQRNLIAGLLGL